MKVLDPMCGQLRQMRRGAGLSLADVEAKSAGRWKAVVVGSYERGDRNPSLPTLRELLGFYGRRLVALDPEDTVVPAAPPAVVGTWLEHCVVAGPERVDCADQAESARLARLVVGGRAGYRVHRVSGVEFPSDPAVFAPPAMARAS